MKPLVKLRFRGLISGRCRNPAWSPGNIHEPNQEICTTEMIELTIDVEHLLYELGRMAIWNKGKKSKAMNGAVKAKVVKDG